MRKQESRRKSQCFSFLFSCFPHCLVRSKYEGEVMALLSAKKRRVIGGLLLLVLLGGGATAWLQRERLLTWYYLRGLKRANETDAKVWIQRVASRGEAAVPGLLDCMTRDDELLCANARAVLERISGALPQDDPRWT